MSKRLVRLPPIHDGQRVIHRSRARFKVACCGRRWGKTRYAVMDDTERVSRGQAVWWIAPTYKLARVAWRTFVRLAVQVPDGFHVMTSEKRIEQIGGPGYVEVHSSDDPTGLRSAGLDHATLDEHAFGKSEVWTQSIRPALTDRKGSALFISTPFGKNHFYQLHRKATLCTDGTWEAFHFPSSSNPYLDAKEIEDARADMTEREFRQEYLAEFLDEGGEVFRNVRACATATELEEPDEDSRYVFGVDWGKLNDYTVITCLDDETGEVVWRDRFNRIDYTLQKGRLVAAWELFRPVTILAEENAMGAPLIDDLVKEGLPIEPFKTTNSSKRLIVEQLALAFEREEIRIPMDPSLVAELEAYDLERLPGGLIRFNAPSGAHDDQVISLALAWHASRGAVGKSSGYLSLIRDKNAEAKRVAEEERRRIVA